MDDYLKLTDSIINKLPAKIPTDLPIIHLNKHIIEKAREHATKRYHSSTHKKPLTYYFDKFSICYKGVDYKRVGDKKVGTRSISKGTMFKNEDIPVVNLYEIVTKCGKISFPTVRYGTPMNKDPAATVNYIKKLYPNSKIVSLLGNCEGVICKTMFKGMGLIDDLAKEPAFSEIEKKLGVSIFPIGQYGMGANSSTSMNNSSPKETFKSIVNLSVEHYLSCMNGNPYVLAFHCKSGKDRTSVFDAINKATYFYLCNRTTNRRINNQLTDHDYESIRQLISLFLLFGLIIAYNSTGLIGLKIYSNPVARYVLDHNSYAFFKGVY